MEDNGESLRKKLGRYAATDEREDCYVALMAAI